MVTDNESNVTEDCCWPPGLEPTVIIVIKVSGCYADTMAGSAGRVYDEVLVGILRQTRDGCRFKRYYDGVSIIKVDDTAARTIDGIMLAYLVVMPLSSTIVDMYK